jgi:hypothetical protein
MIRLQRDDGIKPFNHKRFGNQKEIGDDLRNENKYLLP